MVSEKLARRYADAVFSLASDAGTVDRVGDDLAAIAAVIVGTPQFAAFFVAPIVDRAEKERALLTAFGGKVDEIALHALVLLVRKRREALLGALVEQYRRLQLASRGEEPLTVASARPLSSDDLRALVGRLERLYAKKFEVTQVVDPSLI
ncbi:MAG TPA: ATP synthase F1 subunit delta, partial [Candidatus Tumulicola sp.]|nr:ATP synthase F1 subunit delta [Candidatus Tumulicola sp.]